MLELEHWRALAWALDLPALTGPLVHGPGHPDNDTVTALIKAQVNTPPQYLTTAGNAVNR